MKISGFVNGFCRSVSNLNLFFMDSEHSFKNVDYYRDLKLKNDK